MDPDARGKLHHNQFFKMMRQMPPPLGFGQHCPLKLAYKKMILLNLPVDEDQLTVHFETALFTIVRRNLSIKMPVEMTDWPRTTNLAKKQKWIIKMLQGSAQADEELRQILVQNWPQSRKKLDLLVPRNEKVGRGAMTTGKLYTGLTMMGKWKMYRRKENGVVPV